MWQLRLYLALSWGLFSSALVARTKRYLAAFGFHHHLRAMSQRKPCSPLSVISGGPDEKYFLWVSLTRVQYEFTFNERFFSSCLCRCIRCSCRFFSITISLCIFTPISIHLCAMYWAHTACGVVQLFPTCGWVILVGCCFVGWITNAQKWRIRS